MTSDKSIVAANVRMHATCYHSQKGDVRNLSQRVHVGIWYPKGFPYTYFKAQVYPIYLHGPFGFMNIYHVLGWDGGFLERDLLFSFNNARGHGCLQGHFDGLGSSS